MTDQQGILIARDDGVIVVPDAVATPAGLVAAVEQLLGTMLGAREEQQRMEEER